MSAEGIKQKKLRIVPAVAIYAICLYAVWTLVQCFLYPMLKSKITSDFLMAIVESVCKNLIWTLPAAILIHRHKSEMQISLKEMFTNKVRWWRVLLGCAVIAVWMLIAAWRQNAHFSLSAGDAVRTLFVGITEELVFRGLFLNSSDTEPHSNLAMAINMGMFLMIHFPIWIMEGVFVQNIVSFGFVQILLLSWVFAKAFQSEKNLLVPIILHTFWDLMAFGIGG